MIPCIKADYTVISCPVMNNMLPVPSLSVHLPELHSHQQACIVTKPPLGMWNCAMPPSPWYLELSLEQAACQGGLELALDDALDRPSTKHGVKALHGQVVNSTLT